MILFWIAAAALAVLIIAYVCFRIAFYVPKRSDNPGEVPAFPDGDVYKPYREVMENWAREVRAMPHEEYAITSFDGLTLRGKFYQYSPDAPIELMFHGYRGSAERELSGGVERCFRVGHNAFVVDQRCCGHSQGNVITFGIREHRDCRAWVDFLIGHFGPDARIILTGISMGASTVLMAGGTQLPAQVVGILADCGFSSAREIIKTVIRQMGLPPALSYPFVKLGAKIYGGFDLEETSAIEAVGRCKVPVIFYHGESDDYVPCHMSQALYDACPTRKRLVTIPGAGHGLSYPVAQEAYLEALRGFFGPGNG